MLNYQKLHYDRYYIMDDHGDTVSCSRTECFTPEDDPHEGAYRQRWFYDPEAGYAIRLPRNSMGDVLSRRNQADLKAEERHIARCANQFSIDQPRHSEDGGEDYYMDFPDEHACVEQIVENMDNLAALTRVLARLSEDDRMLIKFLLKKTKKADIAAYFNITKDGVRYHELQLRKKLSENPEFQKIRENF